MTAPMCEATPMAARHSWSTPRTCASSACETIICDLVERNLCRIHLVCWERARATSEQYVLAAKWNWL